MYGTLLKKTVWVFLNFRAPCKGYPFSKLHVCPLSTLVLRPRFVVRPCFVRRLVLFSIRFHFFLNGLLMEWMEFLSITKTPWSMLSKSEWWTTYFKKRSFVRHSEFVVRNLSSERRSLNDEFRTTNSERRIPNDVMFAHFFKHVCFAFETVSKTPRWSPATQ